MANRMTRMANRFDRLEIISRDDANSAASPEDKLIPQGQRRTIMQLNEHTCRWPVGDTANPDFFFCGGDTEHGWVYCSTHRARASCPVRVASINQPRAA